MPDKKITQLTEKTILANNDEFAVVDSAAIPVETKRAKYSNLFRGTFTELTIAAGIVTITGRFHKIDTEGDAATDDLDTISGGIEGMMIIIKPANDARTVVIKHNTGNIWLRDKMDIQLDDLYDTIVLVYNGMYWSDTAGEMPFKDVLGIKAALFWLKPWQDIVGFTASHTGTGAFTPGFIYGLLATGVNIGSRACIYCAQTIYYYNTTSVYKTRFGIRITGATTLALNTGFFGLFTNPTAPTATERHFGFKFNGVDILAVCGDGANGNSADTGVDTGSGITRELYVVADKTVIKYYVDGVLTNTFTTFSPNSASLAATIYMLNGEAAAKTVWTYSLCMVQGA